MSGNKLVGKARAYLVVASYAILQRLRLYGLVELSQFSLPWIACDVYHRKSIKKR